jgi:hypothetical protein
MKDGWVEYVNYSSDYRGEQVTATYSYQDGRYILPGEPVHICDEFGYWRNEPPVTFGGRSASGFYLYFEPDGTKRTCAWQVVRDVIGAQRG